MGTTHYHEMKSVSVHKAKYSVEKHRNKHSERWRDKTGPVHTQLVMSCKASVLVLGSVVSTDPNTSIVIVIIIMITIIIIVIVVVIIYKQSMQEHR